MFVAHGAVVDARRDDGATPYALAIRAANRDGALWLEEQGVDGTCVPTMDRLLGACLAADQQTAHLIAQEHPTLISSLTGSDAGALLTALMDGRDDAVRVMLALQWPLTPESEWGGTALHWAAWNGRAEMVRQLLEHGAPVNVRDSRYGSSSLAWTAHGSRYCARANDEDYPAIVHLLLDAGSTRAEAINQWGEPPESLGRPSVVAVLQLRGFAPSEGG
jgi:ankyrin repeat protein